MVSLFFFFFHSTSRLNKWGGWRNPPPGTLCHCVVTAGFAAARVHWSLAAADQIKLANRIGKSTSACSSNRDWPHILHFSFTDFFTHAIRHIRTDLPLFCFDIWLHLLWCTGIARSYEYASLRLRVQAGNDRSILRVPKLQAKQTWDGVIDS